MNPTFLAAILTASATAYAYSYTINMTSTQLAWYNVTNLISATAWIVLTVLIHLFRTQAWQTGIEAGKAGENGGRAMVFKWIKPLTISLKLFCGLSAVRYLVNVIVIYWHIYMVQNALFFLTNLALAIAVGYASVYYKRIPKLLVRIKQHQLNSRRFEQIADNAVDAFLEIDTLSNIWYANRAAAEMFCHASPKELLGANITDLMPVRFREKHLLGIENYLQTGESGIVNKREPSRLHAMRANGQEFPIELTLSRYDVGEATRFCAIIRDISYKVELEKVVEKSVV